MFQDFEPASLIISSKEIKNIKEYIPLDAFQTETAIISYM